MSVVLRCQTCGTTQTHAGECEACAEGEVQYFCANHDPGVWLDGPVCGRCGARFGERPRATPRAPTRPVPVEGAPDFRPPAARRPRTGRVKPEIGDRPPAGFEPEESSAEVAPPAPSLGDLLEAITERGRRARAPYDPADAPWIEPPVRRAGIPLAGCLFRLLGLVGLLIIAAIMFLLLLFGGFIVD